jgi:hypothetical protein
MSGVALAAIVTITMSSSVEMEGIPPGPPSRIVMKISGNDLTVDVDVTGQVMSTVARKVARPLDVTLTPSGRRQTILGQRCEEDHFIITGRQSGGSRMMTKGVVWIAKGGARAARSLSAPPTPAFGLPGGDFEAFISLLSRIDGIPCRIDSETALEGESEVVDAIRLPIKVKAVLTMLEASDAKD